MVNKIRCRSDIESLNFQHQTNLVKLEPNPLKPAKEVINQIVKSGLVTHKVKLVVRRNPSCPTDF